MQWTRVPRVFIVDDEKIIADTLTKILSARGYEAYAFYSAGSVLQVALEQQPDLLITDVALDPDSINGIDLAIYMQGMYPELQVLLISGHMSSTEWLQQAQREGYNFTLLHKPIPPPELLQAVAGLLSGLEQAQAG